YILPCLPPLALVTGRAADEMVRGALRGPLGMGPRAAAMVTLLLACGVAAAIGLLRVGAAGMLVLLAWAAPPILARRESGRSLFARTGGHEVLVWGAWRTAWMAGYFYNDGRVREISGEPDVAGAIVNGPVFVLTGPSERRRLEAAPGLAVTAAAEGPRATTLLVVRRR